MNNKRPLQRIRLGIASMLVPLLLIGGSSSSETTYSTWRDNQVASTPDVTAGRIGPVIELECEEDNRLLYKEIHLNWKKPEELQEQEVEYLVSWQGRGLLADSGSELESEPQHTYRAGLLSGLGQGSIDFTIIAKLVGSSWQEEPAEQSASGLLRLSGLVLTCD